jgi:RNA polymerase sigma-70 factor (ECF subfamily)
LTDLQQGREANWNCFCRIFTPAVVAFGRRMGLGQQEAEDAAQETWLAFMQAVQAGRYERHKGRLSAWLFGFARRIILKTRDQSIRHRGTASPPEVWDQVPDNEAMHLTWETQWKRVVLSRCLERVRREVDNKVFDAFYRYALQEQPVEDVARQLEMSRNAVYIAKCRVLSRLCELESDLQDVEPEMRS